jgi:hyperosmotically inducible protein
MKKIAKLLSLTVCLGLPLSLYVAATGCAGDRYHRSTGAYLDDKSTSAKVKTELLADRQVKGTQVDVKTYQGKVQLSGFADTDAQKERAAEIARNIKGVEWVKNDIIVRTAVPGTAAGAERSGTGVQNTPSSGTSSQP